VEDVPRKKPLIPLKLTFKRLSLEDLHLVKVWNVPLKSGKTIKVATVEQGERKPSMCEGCEAPCCQGAFRPILTAEEFLSRKFKFTYTPPEAWFKLKAPEVQFLATLRVDKDGCPYFNKVDRKCELWPNPPKACLAYDCREDPRPAIRKFARRRMREWERARIAARR